MEHNDLQAYYSGKKALITGGMDFIGSNLAIKLVRFGAEVTIVDVLWPDHGGNVFNIEPVKKDVRDEYAMQTLMKGKDFIFHLAGQCSHVLGQSDPFPDIDINIHGSAVIMEAVKKHAPEAELFCQVDFLQDGERGFIFNKKAHTSFIQKLPFAEKNTAATSR